MCIRDRSNPSHKEQIIGGHDLNENFDDTVKGVLISDFSPSERLKYLQRSQNASLRTRGQQPLNAHESSTQPPVAVNLTTASEIFQDKMPDFCINI